MKRAIVIIAVVLGAFAVGGTFFVWRLGWSGSTPLEGWIGSQLQAIANGYINPKLSFYELDYEYPGTVHLKNLRLIADDPANPGKTIDILGTESATITLGEIPEVGKPLIIEKVVLNKPLFSAVSVSANSSDFVGFANLMRESSDTEIPKLSDIFRMNLVELIDGRIIYDARIPGTEPMEIDQINTRLNIEPSQDGWYRLHCEVARKPVFDLKVSGKLNLDHFSASDVALNLTADLSAEKLNYLPPQLQQVLRQFEVKGLATISAKGSLPISEPLKGKLDATVLLTDANVTLGDYRVPVDQLDLSAILEDGRAIIPNLRVVALMGELNVKGWCMLNEKMDANVSLTIADMRLEELLAHPKKGQPLPLAGRMNAELGAKAPVQVVLAKINAGLDGTTTALALESLPKNWGNATINLSEGKLLPMPLLKELTRAIGVGGNSDGPTESARMSFELTNDIAFFDELTYTGDALAIRGKGSVGLNRKLDLVFNGGPLEKMQAAMGNDVGRWFGALTDKVARYQVYGVIGSPSVRVIVAGTDVGKAGKQAGNAAKKGIDKILSPFDK